MSVGKIIAEKRKQNNLSQEELADKLGVSRSAVAKWENENGLPDIENIKLLAGLFQMSTDEILEVDECLKAEKENTDYYDKFILHRCDIDLAGWNDGATDAVVTGQDKNFLFYCLKEKSIKGAIAKKYICKISVCEGTGSKEDSEQQGQEFADFMNKEVTINLYEKSFLSGIIGEDTELQAVTITGEKEKALTIEPGFREIPLNQIAKIEIT